MKTIKIIKVIFLLKKFTNKQALLMHNKEKSNLFYSNSD